LIRLYENLKAAPDDPKRFRLELSTGQGCSIESLDSVNGHKTPIAPLIEMNKQLTLQEIETFFESLLQTDKQEQEEKLTIADKISSTEFTRDDSLLIPNKK